jgi:hypothetical protein
MPYKDREEARAYDAAYRAAHREEARAYRAAHREEARAYDAARREERRAYRAAYHAAYHAAHREERRAYNAARVYVAGVSFHPRTTPPEVIAIARLVKEAQAVIRQHTEGDQP